MDEIGSSSAAATAAHKHVYSRVQSIKYSLNQEVICCWQKRSSPLDL